MNKGYKEKEQKDRGKDTKEVMIKAIKQRNCKWYISQFWKKE